MLLMGRLRKPMGAVFGVLGRMAAGGVVAALSRTAVAIAALVIAVSATIGIGIMIDSFRGTVVRWLESTLRSDIYLGIPGRAGGFSGGDLDPEVANRVARLPGVRRVNLLRRTEVSSSTTNTCRPAPCSGCSRAGGASLAVLAGLPSVAGKYTLNAVPRPGALRTNMPPP